jgi:hypothetical protein
VIPAGDELDIPGLFREPQRRAPGASPEPGDDGARGPGGSFWGPARFAAPTPLERGGPAAPPGLPPSTGTDAHPASGDLLSGLPGTDLDKSDQALADRGIPGWGDPLGRSAGAGTRTRVRPSEAARTVPPPPPDPGPPPVGRPYLPPAGRRRSPVLIIVGCAVAVLAAALVYRQSPNRARVAAQATSRPQPSSTPSQASDLSGLTLVEVGTDGSVSVDAFGGQRKTIPNFQAQGYPEQPVLVGSGAAVINAGTVYVVRSAAAPPVPLGPGQALFPAARPGLVGVYRTGPAGQPPTVQLVATTATAMSSMAVTFPVGFVPFAQVGADTLIAQQQAHGYLIELWKPGPAVAGTVLASYGPASAVIGVAGTSFAWLSATGCDSAGECPLHITNLATGAESVVTPPPGYHGFLAAGAYSPANANQLAMLVYDGSSASPGARLAMVDGLAGANGAITWSAVLVPQSEVVPGRSAPGHVVWTPDGKHVLFSGGSGFIEDYGLGNPACYATEAPASYAFTVF